MVTKLCGKCHKKALAGKGQFGLPKGGKEVFMEKLTLELNQRFSKGFNFAPKGIWQCLETFQSSKLGKKGLVVDTRWVKTRNHPAMYITTTPKEWVIKLKNSNGPSLRNSELDLQTLMRISY